MSEEVHAVCGVFRVESGMFGLWDVPFSTRCGCFSVEMHPLTHLFIAAFFPGLREDATVSACLIWGGGGEEMALKKHLKKFK